jgi:uncharacterized membrane protein YuzA (DUF378 family)
VKGIYTTALVLIVIGGVNWGLVGFFDYNLIDSLFGVASALSRIIYALVGLAALYVIAVKVMVRTKQVLKASPNA